MEKILHYPNTINNYQATSTTITIQDSLADNQNITVRAYQLPILDNDLSLIDSNTLQEQFDHLRARLIEKIVVLPISQEQNSLVFASVS